MERKFIRWLSAIFLFGGCILIVLTLLWLGLALVAAGLLILILLDRCPKCGKHLLGLPRRTKTCPKCGSSL